MTTITGTTIQAEFNTSVEITTLEIMIDGCVDTVNLDAGLSIAYMTGVAGAKTITVTGGQAAAIKPLMAMRLASRATAGGSSSSYNIGPVGVSSSSNSSPSDVNAEQYERAIRNLCARDFRRA